MDDEDDDLDDHGFGKVGRLAVDDEGGMGKDEDDEGYAQVACVIEHEGVAARLYHAFVIAAPVADEIGQEKTKDHEDGHGGDHRHAGRGKFRFVYVGENEAGNDQVKHELGQGFYVYVKFPV
ncbi:Uncharacterised protein [uncultured Ruminococcus sp.]|nr:Uncharacterised protein [uncultured Ruminococcus sp.]